MFLRRQRTKQLTNFTFERIDELIQIFEIQLKVKISIRSIFESKSFFLINDRRSKRCLFLEDVDIIDVVKN